MAYLVEPDDLRDVLRRYLTPADVQRAMADVAARGNNGVVVSDLDRAWARRQLEGKARPRRGGDKDGKVAGSIKPARPPHRGSTVGG